MSSAVATATLLPERPARRHVWTPAEDEVLRLAYQTREPIEDVAKAIGVSLASVWRRAGHLNLPRKPKAGPGLWQEARECGLCGASFVVTKAWLNGSPGRYCSKKCANRARRRQLYAELIEDNSIPEPNSGCWLWTGAINGFGYGAIRISGEQWHAHRLSYVLSRGELSFGQSVIRHLCNNPACVNPDHLSAGTTYDNAQDRIAAGHQARGSQVHNAKLTEAWIPAIISQHRAGASERWLAGQYGVSQRAISFVLKGVTWRHASGL